MPDNTVNWFPSAPQPATEQELEARLAELERRLVELERAVWAGRDSHRAGGKVFH